MRCVSLGCQLELAAASNHHYYTQACLLILELPTGSNYNNKPNPSLNKNAVTVPSAAATTIETHQAHQHRTVAAASRTDASESYSSERNRATDRGSFNAASARHTSTRADATSSRLSCSSNPNARGSPSTASARAPRRQVSSARAAVACSGIS